MADIFVRSTDGSDADNGSTWALAKATLSGAAAIDAAGDTIYLSDNHAESTASAVTVALAGTAANPVRVLCVDDTGDPASPTTMATTATVTTTGNSPIAISGCGLVYGIAFSCGTTAVAPSISLGAASVTSSLTLEECPLRLAATGSGAVIGLGNASTASYSEVVLKNSTLQFAATGQRLQVANGRFELCGVSLIGATFPTTLIDRATPPYACDLLITGCDLSNLGSGAIINGSNLHPGMRVTIRDTRIGASTTLISGTIARPGARVTALNIDNGATNYRLWVEDYAGSIRDETTLVRSGGATDGTTTISWKMTSKASAGALRPLVSPDIMAWQETTGASITVTVEILHDSLTALTDAQVWVEVDYPGSSSHPQATRITDARASVLASGANQTTSTETWTTTGLTNPNKQKLAVTFTPQAKGLIRARVVLAMASKVIYVDPEITVS